MEERIISLCELAPFGAARVVSIGDAKLSGRLGALGVYEGVGVVRLYDAPSGDPTAYEAGGTVFALRRSDARSVKVGVDPKWV